MLSFNAFIILEAGDNPYPFKEMSKTVDYEHDDEHPHSATYHFNADGTKYFASVDHYNDKEAQVVFGSHDFKNEEDDFKSPYELRGDKGAKAARIMSTIHHIVKRHVMNHPNLTRIGFTSDISEPTRISLYTRYTKKMGGDTHDSEEDIHSKVHIIPADSYRK